MTDTTDQQRFTKMVAEYDDRAALQAVLIATKHGMERCRKRSDDEGLPFEGFRATVLCADAEDAVRAEAAAVHLALFWQTLTPPTVASVLRRNARVTIDAKAAPGSGTWDFDARLV